MSGKLYATRIERREHEEEFATTSHLPFILFVSTIVSVAVFLILQNQ